MGIIDSLYSDILNESREIYIHLPESYDKNSSRKYPVIYVLDGEVILKAAATVYDFYWGGYMPEMLIIGISNHTNRTRDLTTSEVKFRRGAEFNQETGGAENFTAFIEKELIPYVEKNYPVTGYRTLIGHSYAGLFTISALINHTDLFENYLAIDPSLDWDNQKLLIQSKEILRQESFKGKSIFLSLGGQLHMQNSGINIENVMEDTGEYTLFARSNIEFYQVAKNNSQSGINIQWKYYPQDLHGTVPLPSILDGLIFFFKWFQMENTDKFNNPETPLDELLQVIREREQKLEEHFGYFVPPYDEDLLNMLGYMNMEMGQLEKSLAFFLLGIEYFPSSANAYDSLADYYVAQGDFKNALINETRAFEISGSEYHRQRMEEFK
jgi:predicted alpha/beta superfamily hydrolase